MNAKKQVIFIAVGVALLVGLCVWGYTLTKDNPPQEASVEVSGTTSEDATAVSNGATDASDTAVVETETVDATMEEASSDEGESSEKDGEKEKKSPTKVTAKPKATKKPTADKKDDDTKKKTSSKSKKTSKKNASKKKNKKSSAKSSGKTDSKTDGDSGSGTVGATAPQETKKDFTSTLGGITITSADAACEVSGKVATIKKAGTYTMSGSASDGQLVVNAAKTDAITIVCNNVTLTNSNSSAIYIKSADQVTLQLQDGTKNTFTDGTSYALASGMTEPDGAIFSQEDLTISGGGSLTVNARYLDGIVSKNDLKVKGGTVTVNAKDDGFRGKDSIQISGGKVVIVSELAHGMKTTEDADSSKGFVMISGGDTSIDAEKDGIHATRDITVSGGKLYVDAKNESIDTDGKFTISGGTAVLDGPKSENHASLTCEGGYFINGGTFLAVGSSTLIKAPATSSKQKFIFYKHNVELPTESRLFIRSSAGKNLIDHTSTRKFQNVIFSSPDLKSGKYGILIGATHLTDVTVD